MMASEELVNNLYGISVRLKSTFFSAAGGRLKTARAMERKRKEILGQPSS
jgi:hypothetical protein